MGDGVGVEARRLLRAATTGVLATESGGQPFASLVTPATAPDASVLVLLSGLSDHTKHLRDNPRCAVMVTGAAEGANPQTAPRLTVTGEAAAEPDAGLKARWLARHPYAGFYADLPDFRLVRVRLTGGHFVGGFARAARLAVADLLPPAEAVAAVAAREADIMAHCNADHGDAMAAIAERAGAWRMTAVDCDGCDLAQGETVVRVAWPAPVVDADGVRRALIGLARVGRGHVG